MRYRSISMAYTRAFSFTDENTGVTGLIPPRPRKATASNTRFSFVQQIDTAVRMNDLRQIQSTTYQRLFQSDRPDIGRMWSCMSRALQRMQDWLENLPSDCAAPLREAFRADVLFSGILILSPPLQGKLCEYGKFMIFEYGSEYADLMTSMVKDDEGQALITYQDFLRAVVVSDRFVELLYNDTGALFNGTVPSAPSETIPPTTIPERNVGEMVNKAHRCLDQFEKTFEYLGQKYGYSDSRDTFKAKAQVVRRSLKGIYDWWMKNLGVSRNHYLSSTLPTNGV